MKYAQLLLFEHENKAGTRCSTGVCSFELNIANDKVLDVASEPLLRKLLGVPEGPLVPAITADNARLLRNSVRNSALQDLVRSAWEGSPRVTDIACLWPKDNDCEALLLDGKNDSIENPVANWLHVKAPRGFRTWYARPGSLLETATAHQTFPLALKRALTQDGQFAVIARDANEFLIHYSDAQGFWLAIWDAQTLSELVRVSSKLSSGVAADQAAPVASSQSFGRALMDVLKQVRDPQTASIVEGQRGSIRTYSLRQPAPQGESLAYLSANLPTDKSSVMQANLYCVRTATAQSLVTSIAAGKHNAEIPATFPEDPASVIDDLRPFLGVDIKTWRSKGFLVNPLAMLEQAEGLPPQACIRQ